jgi:hypothetical protein
MLLDVSLQGLSPQEPTEIQKEGVKELERERERKRKRKSERERERVDLRTMRYSRV